MQVAGFEDSLELQHQTRWCHSVRWGNCTIAIPQPGQFYLFVSLAYIYIIMRNGNHERCWAPVVHQPSLIRTEWLHDTFTCTCFVYLWTQLAFRRDLGASWFHCVVKSFCFKWNSPYIRDYKSLTEPWFVHGIPSCTCTLKLPIPWKHPEKLRTKDGFRASMHVLQSLLNRMDSCRY